MACSATVLAWSVLEFTAGYKAAGQYTIALENIKWVTDYFIKCVGDGKSIVVQVSCCPLKSRSGSVGCLLLLLSNMMNDVVLMCWGPLPAMAASPEPTTLLRMKWSPSLVIYIHAASHFDSTLSACCCA